MGKNEAVKKKYCLRHATPNPKKADKQRVWRVEFIFFSVMLPILANYYTALIFLVTFLIKQKSNKLLMGG
jgi:hypothetical protein